MSDKRHYDRVYHNPHPDTYLAFIARGVHLICEAPRRTILNDPNRALLIGTSHRILVDAAFPTVAPEQAAYIADREMYLTFLQVKNAELERALRQRPRPAKGNRRRVVPAHQPLRPHMQIIAGTIMRLRMRSRGKTTNKFRAEAAKLLNDGLATRDFGHALTGWNMRTADEAFWSCDLATLRQAARKERGSGKTHEWDRRFFDISRDMKRRVAATASEDEAGQVLIDLLADELTKKLDAIHDIYRAARADPRFAGLVGVKLADRVDLLEGFERTFDKLMVRPMFVELGIPKESFIPHSAA